MNTQMILLMIAVPTVCTFFLRVFPFLVFSGGRKMPDWLQRLGQALPAAIMAVLIVYCLKDVGTDMVSIGIPKLLAVLLVAVSYKWKHNTFLSICMGTGVYMSLCYFL